MAELYLARQRGIEGFEKLVALKRTLPEHATNVEFIAMFLDEARLVASLSHPNIVQVMDLGQDGDFFFYAMEYLDGCDAHTLQAVTDRRGERLPLEHALAIVLGAAAGLHAAHEARGPNGARLEVVHRDVSPTNVMVTVDGAVKLIDFGVAKAASRTTTTRHGVVKGKLSYMSPEQCLCLPLDRRSDVFALGIMLYELTTGSRLFDHPDKFLTMRQIVRDPITSPRDRVADYPGQIAAIVECALEKRPQDRFATADQMYRALIEAARTLGLQLSAPTLGQFVRRATAAPTVEAFGAPRLVDTAEDSDYAAIEVSHPRDRPQRFESMDTLDLGRMDTAIEPASGLDPGARTLGACDDLSSPTVRLLATESASAPSVRVIRRLRAAP